MDKEIVYNKLVRDKIPEIILSNGKTPVLRTATVEEVGKLLHLKLVEELEEFHDSPNEEELADLLEVIEAMAREYRLDMDKVMEAKAKKKDSRGGFQHRIVLVKVVDKE